jgi:hypothetical protein
MPEEKTPKHQPKPTHQAGTGKGEEKVKASGKEAGRHDTGTKGAKRPTGKSTGRASTGVNPKKPIQAESPDVQAP